LTLIPGRSKGNAPQRTQPGKDLLIRRSGEGMTGSRTTYRVQRIKAWALGALSSALLALNLLAITGFLARDRNVLLALLLYLPLIPLGLAAISLDLICRGRSLKRARFSLACVGLAVVTCSCFTMIGRGPSPLPTTGAATAPEVRLLHWNVLWGGRPRTDASWTSMEDAIVSRRPDVVVLSEAPPEPWLDSLERRLGDEWSSARVQHDPASFYWYKLVVLSRWPVERGRAVAIRNGTAVDVRVEQPGRPVRLLVVDGRSKVTQLRTPMLLDITEACRRAADTGDPFDVVVGDFNAVSRSVGFDALRAAAGGYDLASWSSTGWRGTWPMPLPVFDIDHIWVRAGVRVLSCSIFAALASDHRGQLVRLTVPGGPPATASLRTNTSRAIDR
jgi:vancomycin resistance protein VanJ